MDILPKDTVKPGQILTEQDYKYAADKAYVYAVIGLVIPLLEIEVFRCADRARKSQNPEILATAQKAVNMATTVFFYIVIFPLIILSCSVNLFAGIVVAFLCAWLIYVKRKNIWSKNKIIIAMIAIILFLAYGIFAVFDNAKTEQKVGIKVINNTMQVVCRNQYLHLLV